MPCCVPTCNSARAKNAPDIVALKFAADEAQRHDPIEWITRYPPGRDSKRHRGRRRSGGGGHASDGTDERAKDFRSRSRRLARRLVLAARVRPAGGEGPQGVRADHDGAWRAL